MQFGDSIRISLGSLARHPLRVSLAALGIAVGIATLVIVVSAEQSWNQALDRWYEMRGVDVIQVGSMWRPVVGGMFGVAVGAGSAAVVSLTSHARPEIR